MNMKRRSRDMSVEEKKQEKKEKKNNKHMDGKSEERRKILNKEIKIFFFLRNE